MRECMNYIANSASRLEEVIQNLVEYSRNSHQEINLVPVNLFDTVYQIVNELAFIPNTSKISINNNIKKDQIIHTDESRLKIILHNIINNGIKYADFNKPESYINIDQVIENGYFKLKVADNGIGIDKTHCKSIFKMYYRASEQSDGSGLGLFIVSEIVNKLSGAIEVSSEKGKGTTFIISIPIVHEAGKKEKVEIEA